MMRKVLAGMLLCSGLIAIGFSKANAQTLNVRVLPVHARSGVPDWVCEVKRGKSPSGKAAATDDPLVIPDQEVLEIEKEELLEQFIASNKTKEHADGGFKQPLFQPQALDQPFRLAIWGDSHMAAAFFSTELVRVLGLKTEQAQTAFVPANMNRGGVRLSVRKTCVSSGWRYESAHANHDAAQAPGPGLVNLFSTEKDAYLVWDVRNSNGQAERSKVKILFQQGLAPIRVGLSVDGAEEQELVLSGHPGPASLELQGDAPLSLVKIRLLEGNLRVHGMQWDVPSTTKLQLDLFGYPGATVAGWKQSDMAYFKQWFTDNKYQLVILAYGTNEGNNKPFEEAAYKNMLTQSVTQMRSVFPQSACLLIAPGDRGVLIRQSSALKIKSKGVQKKKNTTSKHATQQKDKSKTPLKAMRSHPDLFMYSRIHAQIGTIQKEVAEQYDCKTWSMFEAMGGSASAYQWARMKPAWMAADLVHFTVAGYERLAQKMAQDIGWRPELIWFSR